MDIYLHFKYEDDVLVSVTENESPVMGDGVTVLHDVHNEKAHPDSLICLANSMISLANDMINDKDRQYVVTRDY